MKVGIMQPYFFPYLGYFQLIHAVDKFVVYDDVNFIKRGWVNRNNFLVDGKAKMLTVPLVKASQNKKINQCIISYEEAWPQKMLKTLAMSYKKAPYFSVIYPLLEETLLNSYESISELNLKAIQKICFFLDLSTEIIPSSSIFMNNTLKGEGRILDICLQEKAMHYINPIGGRGLYSIEAFSKREINLSFLAMDTNIIYPQLKNKFIPFLSIIDILMFNSVPKIKEMLSKYKLLKS